MAWKSTSYCSARDRIGGRSSKALQSRYSTSWSVSRTRCMRPRGGRIYRSLKMRYRQWSIDAARRALEGNNKNAFLHRLAGRLRIAIQRRLFREFGAFFLGATTEKFGRVVRLRRRRPRTRWRLALP